MRDRGWMVCNVNSEPVGELFATENLARESLFDYPPGCDYHVRPVSVSITVLGTPPQPWWHVVPSVSGGRDAK